MEFGIKTYSVARIRRGKLSKAEELRLRSGEMIKEVAEEEYKYLGILEFDQVKLQNETGI